MFDQVHGQIAAHEQFSYNVPSRFHAIIKVLMVVDAIAE
jgi:hypothetical protein